MHEHRATALVRLGLLAAVALLAAVFACRPAWSPDGTKVLYPMRVGKDRFAVALYDRTTRTATVVFTPNDGDALPVPMWLPDGKAACVVWVRKKQPSKHLCATVFAIPAAGPPRTVEVTTQGDAMESILVPPVPIGGSLIFADQGLCRLDLGTGAVVRGAPMASQTAVARRGAGACVVTFETGKPWQLGAIDPATLEVTPLLRQPEGSDWIVQPTPVFTADLRRVAFAARRGGRAGDVAILVFADGKLEATLPIGGHHDTTISGIEWLPDGAALVASLFRSDAEGGGTTCVLFETTVGGSVSRETPIVRLAERPRDLDQLTMAAGIALAPDGRTAALTTALIEKISEQDAGLYLVDLAHKARPVTRVPFPPMPQ